MSNPWFRLYHEFATDPKIQMLSEINQRRYVMLLCMRCNSGDKTLSDEVISFQLRISKEEWNQTKTTLIETDLIDELSKPAGWDKRQYVSDTSTERSRKHRKKKQQQCNVAATPPDTDTDTDTDIDTDIDTEKSKTTKKDFSKKKPVPYKKIIELYHKRLPELSIVLKVTAKRKTQIRQRFNEDMDALENCKNYFDYVGESDFLMGRIQSNSGREPFKADLEWLTHSGNFTKISEGKYHV